MPEIHEQELKFFFEQNHVYLTYLPLQEFWNRTFCPFYEDTSQTTCNQTRFFHHF